MAQKIEIQTLSDLSGEDGAVTTQFSYLLQGYEVDLTAEEVARLEKTLAPFIDVARRVHGTGAAALKGFKGSRAGSTRPGSNASEVREWLTDHGYVIAARGRISAELHTAWVNKTPAQEQVSTPVSTPDSTPEPTPAPEPVSEKRVKRGSL